MIPADANLSANDAVQSIVGTGDSAKATSRLKAFRDFPRVVLIRTAKTGGAGIPVTSW
jgi:hypothetical protein